MKTITQKSINGAGEHGEWFSRDRKTGEWIPRGEMKLRRKEASKCRFVQFSYKEEMELARQSRDALLAVRAELYRLHFQAWDKKAPIAFNNAALQGLGFSHHDKIRALKALEAAKWITVRWRVKRSPEVVILKGFYLGS